MHQGVTRTTTRGRRKYRVAAKLSPYAGRDGTRRIFAMLNGIRGVSRWWWRCEKGQKMHPGDFERYRGDRALC